MSEMNIKLGPPQDGTHKLLRSIQMPPNYKNMHTCQNMKGIRLSLSQEWEREGDRENLCNAYMPENNVWAGVATC